MRTVQMTLDDELVETVDRVVHALKTTRSAFTRMALQEALKKQSELRLVEKHREGYARCPVRSGEFDDWEVEQAWGDE
jgi:metal-responsive CopG/Arc/MetJ family transcriptional regulator